MRWNGMITKLLLIPIGMLIGAGISGSTHAQTPSMRGFADVHNHQFANMAFGGRVVTGVPYGSLGDVLSSARDLDGHSYNHAFDILGANLANGPLRWYGNDGYPNFGGWPNFYEVTHQKMHETMLKRAVDGGLRLTVMFAVESPLLCEAVVRNGGKSDGRDCNDEMTSINSQIDAAYAMQAEIDSEFGGPGKGWYRIVTTPADARLAIMQGKLAVVLGVETSHLFQCHTEPCSWEAPLNALWNKGVRHFFLVHHDVNAFGGPSYFNSLFQGTPGVTSDILHVAPYDLPTRPCAYSYGPHLCDAVGLTTTGKALLQRLITMGAVIDVDHMSDLTFASTLDIAEHNAYPVIASHAGFNAINKNEQDHEGQLTQAELQRIQRTGGMVGLISSQGDLNQVNTYQRGSHTIAHGCGRSTETFAQAYYYALDHAPGMPLAVGTDMNGPLRQVGPRFQGPNPLEDKCDGGGETMYARLAPTFLARGSNIVMARAKVGNRIFDFNTDGLAQEGLLPDMFADLEMLGVGPSELEPLFHSAEGYVKMWEAGVVEDVVGDFDGDGRADRAQVRKDTGEWFVKLANGNDPANIGIPWGWKFPGMRSSDTIALGDYDGDGKTDRAIVDPVAGNWYVLLSSGKDASTIGIPWGWHWGGMGANHVLAIGDYDGDGKTDRAIVDPVAGNWYVLLSSGKDASTIGIPWGWHWGGMGANHVLALGDYDGDGKTDRAIVDPVAGNWYVLLSSGKDASTIGIPWGWHWGGMGANHVLALGDYDGDGKTDRAIVDPVAGNWYVLLSSGKDASTIGIPWGWHWGGMSPQDKLVLGDFDGDKRTDRSIVSNGGKQWYVLPSSGADAASLGIPWASTIE